MTKKNLQRQRGYKFGYTGHSDKISIMIWTILTKADCTASNHSYILIQNNSTNNNVHYCWKFCTYIICQLTLIRWVLTATSGTKPIKCPLGMFIFDAPKSEKRKYHSVWLQETGNSCTSVFPNTHAWEQQEWNKIMKQTKKVREAWVWKKGKRARKKKYRRPIIITK